MRGLDLRVWFNRCSPDDAQAKSGVSVAIFEDPGLRFAPSGRRLLLTEYIDIQTCQAHHLVEFTGGAITMIEFWLISTATAAAVVAAIFGCLIFFRSIGATPQEYLTKEICAQLLRIETESVKRVVEVPSRKWLELGVA